MISSDKKTKDFGGWMNVIHRYGPGKKEPKYMDTVSKIYKSIK